MFQEDLNKHLLNFSTSPFLFIGSGVSRRYIGLETWEALLGKMTEELKLTKPFEYYTSNANGDLSLVASLVGEEFNELWWTNDRYKESRAAYSSLAKSKHSPLKFEIAKYIQEKQEQVMAGFEAEINLLKKVYIDGIITTNWDSLLESFFPDFTRFIGQEELIFSELFSIGEVYKIHGCSTKPETLVLTKEDYDDFHERNPYLAAKLLTIFMEHPIIFIGYSLDDVNIQQILKSIIKCLTKENVGKLKDRLIFCQWSSTPVTTNMSDSTLLISDTVIPIKLVTVHEFTELFSVLANNKKKLPIKILRQMKGMIYDFVKSADPKSKVFVSDNLENLEDNHDVEFVYGVGLKERFSDLGIKGIESRDLFRDAIIDKKWDAGRICKLVLANSNSRYLPYFKYLRLGNFLNSSGELDIENDVKEFTPYFVNKINSIKVETFYPPETYSRKKGMINKKYASFIDLKKDCNFLHILMYAPLLDPEKIKVEDLGTFLKSNMDKLIESKYGTHYRKLICLYDYLKYKYPMSIKKGT